MIVFDTEDNSQELLAAGKSGFGKKVTQIAAITDSGKRFHNRGEPGEFFNWVTHTGDTDLWAFNSQYDIGNLCNRGDLKLYHFDLTLIKGRFIRGRLGNLNFFDVHNLSGQGSSVGKLGSAVGLPKFGFDYKPEDLAKFSKSVLAEFLRFSKTGPERFRDKRYVFRDCEIPMAWLKFVEKRCAELSLENIPATLGTLCTKTYHAMGFENWFEASENSAESLQGARVEIFSGGGHGRIVWVDLNSLYPWCMTQLFPDCIEKLDSLEGYGIAKIDVEVPKGLFVAPLPTKDAEGRLIFPVGKFGGVWTIHEIKKACAMGARVLRTHWIYGSRTAEYPYRDYILDIYGRRLKARGESENLFWKLLLNNLYGRLAINGEISRSLLLTEENREKGIPYGDKILAEHKMPLPAFTNYLHASHVLSYARLRLLDYLLLIPRDSLIYCDTDSMMFFWPEDKPLPFALSGKLGEMKLVSIGECCEPYLPKTYRFDDQYTAKGVPKNRAKEFIETGATEFDLPFKMRESIRFYDKGNSRKLSVWRKVEKVSSAGYDRKRKSGKYFLPKILESE